jgi:hypothetical protein
LGGEADLIIPTEKLMGEVTREATFPRQAIWQVVAELAETESGQVKGNFLTGKGQEGLGKHRWLNALHL